MQLIVGLGNPGTKYAGTRHNAGFMAVTAIAEKYGVTRWKEEHQAHTATINVDGEKVMLVMPQTFMNLSGDAVGPLMRYYKLSPADVIVIYDDMDLPVGQLRLRVKGSAGGHNGMKSVIAHLGTDQFPHVRIGIGRPQPGWDGGRGSTGSRGGSRHLHARHGSGDESFQSAQTRALN